MKAFIGKFIRFGVVGFSGFLIDFSLTWFFRDIVGIYELVANGIGFCFGASSNYILNRRWTWRSQNPNIRGEFIRFFAVSVAGLGINSMVIWFCLEIGNLDLFGLPDFWISKLIATGVVMMWNFIVNNFFTFRIK